MIAYRETYEASRAVWVTERVYALDEPWRSRFLQLIATCALAEPFDSTPSRADVLVWLDDQELNELIMTMLRSWTHRSN
jgi:hypothetical protein